MLASGILGKLSNMTLKYWKNIKNAQDDTFQIHVSAFDFPEYSNYELVCLQN